MKRILVVESGSGRGGSAAYLYSFLSSIDRVRFDPVVVMYYQSSGKHIDQIRELGIPLFFLQSCPKKSISWNQRKSKISAYLQFAYYFFVIDLPMIVRLVLLIRRKRIELALFNNDVILNIPGVLAAIIAGVPRVVRKSGVGTESAGTRKLDRLLTRFIDVFIASSNAEQRAHIMARLPARKLVTIYEGVDTAAYAPVCHAPSELLQKFGIPSTCRVVGSISRFDVGKGHEDFLKAAQLVLAVVPGVRFLIVGDDVDFRHGAMRMALENQVANLGIQQATIFTGWRTDIQNILSIVDVFVHCPNTWREGMGIATLEAIASGKPVVVTDNWGLAETTVDGYNGFLVPIGDYQQLAKCIISLLRDDTMRAVMGEHARARAQAEFDIRTNVKRIEAILQETINDSACDA